MMTKAYPGARLPVVEDMMRRVVLACLSLALSACHEHAPAPYLSILDASEDAPAASHDSSRPTDAAWLPDASPGDGSQVGPDSSLADAVGSPEYWMEDVTARAGIEFERAPADDGDNYINRMAGGVCVLDVDHRPPRDLFFALPSSHGGSSYLYVSDGSMHFVDETSLRGLTDVGDARGCLAFDADGDGDDDLLVTGIGSVRLLLAEGGGFIDRSTLLGWTPVADGAYGSAAAGDLDGDGDLDLVIAGLFAFRRSPSGPSCVGCGIDPANYQMLANVVLLRQDDGSYEDATSRLSARLALPEPTLTIQVIDLNGDGRMDILEGNDLGGVYPNRALVNDGAGSFRERTRELGLYSNRRGYRGDSMGMVSGDVNGDGNIDHVFTSFEADATAVFLCDASGTCEDQALATGTVSLAGSFRWGPALVDLDLDGWPELIEATGHVYTASQIHAFGLEGPMDQYPNLMASNGDGTLRPIAPTPEDGRATRRSMRGIAVTDLDEDGQPDVVFAPLQGSPLLLRTARPRVGHYLHINLKGRSPNTAAVGAIVSLRVGSRVLVRLSLAGEGYLGSFDSRLFFGFPESSITSIEVSWPDGTRTVLTDVALDADITIMQP